VSEQYDGPAMAQQILRLQKERDALKAERDAATLAERKAVLDILWNYAGRKDLCDDDESLLKHLYLLICARSKT
jgi:hypothetical protein